MESFFIFLGKFFILIIISGALYKAIEDYGKLGDSFSTAFALVFWGHTVLFYLVWWMYG